jgi:hypothetical protein
LTKLTIDLVSEVIPGSSPPTESQARPRSPHLQMDELKGTKFFEDVPGFWDWTETIGEVVPTPVSHPFDYRDVIDRAADNSSPAAKQRNLYANYLPPLCNVYPSNSNSTAHDLRGDSPFGDDLARSPTTFSFFDPPTLTFLLKHLDPSYIFQYLRAADVLRFHAVSKATRQIVEDYILDIVIPHCRIHLYTSVVGTTDDNGVEYQELSDVNRHLPRKSRRVFQGRVLFEPNTEEPQYQYPRNKYSPSKNILRLRDEPTTYSWPLVDPADIDRAPNPDVHNSTPFWENSHRDYIFRFAVFMQFRDSIGAKLYYRYDVGGGSGACLQAVSIPLKSLCTYMQLCALG